MCWMTRYEADVHPKVSDGSIKCWKICKRVGKAGISSWYEQFEYEVGKTYHTKVLPPTKLFGLGEYYGIDEGFHSYSDKVKPRFDKSLCVAFNGGVAAGIWMDYDKIPVIVECHIPKDSEYYENEWGEMVSEAITVDSITITEGKTNKREWNCRA